MTTEKKEDGEKRCGYCVHPPHRGLCNGRSGGTAWACMCHHDTTGQAPAGEGPMSTTCKVCKRLMPLAGMVDHGYCAHSVISDRDAELSAARKVVEAARRTQEVLVLEHGRFVADVNFAALRDALAEYDAVSR